jgi:hypothetical protein
MVVDLKLSHTHPCSHQLSTASIQQAKDQIHPVKPLRKLNQYEERPSTYARRSDRAFFAEMAKSRVLCRQFVNKATWN